VRVADVEIIAQDRLKAFENLTCQQHVDFMRSRVDDFDRPVPFSCQCLLKLFGESDCHNLSVSRMSRVDKPGAGGCCTLMSALERGRRGGGKARTCGQSPRSESRRQGTCVDLRPPLAWSRRRDVTLARLPYRWFPRIAPATLGVPTVHEFSAKI